ncbi:ABC-type branched-chain amino acid transport system, substrate-binding protein [Parafrankia irregularis]|uniref:ABC-type branched-chain amino acid transport system, substrate-binding protein n=1 Tax=Parafrankia irregularis TaxID=795642 RepID=A0A0S4QM67_9ACTN|nr:MULTISPECIES: ABC transporter substrate-binding protein [Parafrankia]MBE3200152.1 ABC transporter substrate-binding protein [Parafrankia sp. CH37]CUU56656.1 ABC-type branched-chain amino acid transport system, substrate-binding protein [Parafrankia irregularis]
MRRRSRLWGLGLAASLAAAVLAGCGGSGSGGSESSNARGIEGRTIKIGGLVEQRAFGGADDGFKARIDRANSTKELGDYTIDYLGSTDPGQGAVDKALATTQSLIDRDDVYAVAPVLTTSFQQSVANYAVARKVPYFGGGFTPAFCSPNQYGFSTIGCYISADYGYTTPVEGVAKALGKKPDQVRWAVVSLAQPDGQKLADNYRKLIETVNGKVVYSEATVPPGGGGDLQPFVSAVMDSKPDAVWLLLGSEVLGFSSAMKAAGYTGALVNSSFYLPGTLQKVPTVAAALEGAIVSTNTPVLESNSTYIQQLEKDFKAIGKSADDVTFGALSGYQAADMMIAMMKKVAPDFGDLVSTIGKGFKYEPGRDAAPVSWPEAFDGSVGCNTVLRVENGSYKIVAPYSCTGRKVEFD